MKLLILLGFVFSPVAFADSDTKVIRKGGSYVIDFNETLVEGKMKAPTGFYLEGRRSKEKRQMVTLRKNWRSTIVDSKAGARALTK